MLSVRKLHHRGDTLIEVTIALGILTLLLATATTSAIRSYRASDAARERTVAINIAQTQADALRAYRNSMAWNDFVAPPIAGETDRITAKIYNWYLPSTSIPSNYAYPGFGGRDPNIKLDASDNTVPTSALTFSSMTSGGTSATKGAFYMCTFQDPIASCDRPNDGQTNLGWYLSKKQAKKVSQVNNEYYYTIVGNRANIYINDPTKTICDLTDNVIRFDIRVKWRSRLSNTVQEASLVMYLANTTTDASPTRVGCS